MKPKLFACLCLTAALPAATLAHPGHEVVAPADHPLHYFVEPLHLVSIIAVTLIAGAAGWWLMTRRPRDRRSKRR